MENKFVIGQIVFSVPRDKRGSNPRNVEITSIGRKWIGIGKDRFDKDTMLVDAGQYPSPAKIYLSEELYKNETEINKRWRKIVNDYQYRTPSKLSLAGIEKIEKIINGEPV